MKLTDAEREAFARNGFLGPYDLFDPATAARLLGRIRDEVVSTRCAIYAHTQADLAVAEYKRDRHLDSPLVYRIATAPAILDRLPPLLGPDILLWRSDGFEIGPGDTPVGHQRVPVEVDVPLSIGAWITFTRTTQRTGALWVVPGTHEEVIPEVPGQGFAGMKYVPSRTFEPSDGRMLELEAGQFILFHNLLVHGSYPVLEGRRTAFTMRYVGTRTLIHHRSNVNAQGQDLSHWGAVLVRGHDRMHRNVLRAPPTIGTGPILEEQALTDPA